MYSRYEHDRGEYRSIPETAGIFSTYPSPHLSYAGGVFDQFLGTAVLLVCLCAITDKSNMQVRLWKLCITLDGLLSTKKIVFMLAMVLLLAEEE